MLIFFFIVVVLGFILILTSIICFNTENKTSGLYVQDALHEKRNKVVEMASKGYDEEQIAKELGIGKNEVRLIIRRYKAEWRKARL